MRLLGRYFLLLCTGFTACGAPARDGAQPGRATGPGAVARTSPKGAPATEPTGPSEPSEPSEAFHPPDFHPPGADGWGQAGGLRYLEVVKGGAAPDARLPMVVFIHGLGDRPRDVWVRQAGRPMRVIMPQAPKAYGRGFSWFDYRAGDRDPEALASGIAAAAERLARSIALLARKRPTRGRPIVGGFSQGGMLSYALAIRHGQFLSAAFPVSGMLPRPLWPRAHASPADATPIHAFHGEADVVVPIAPARALVSHLDSLGYQVTLRSYPGLGHSVSPAVGQALGAAVDAAVERVQ